MKIEQQHIDIIKGKFAEMQTKEDLVQLLSIAKNILYDKETNPFHLKSLTYYANPAYSKHKRFKSFTILKKSGKERVIHAPAKGLKSMLRALNLILQVMCKPNQFATGFVPQKSVVDNAKIHIGSNYVYNIDLKDFFHSFDRNRVKMAFVFEPFNLNGDREPLAFLLACLCTHPFDINGRIQNVLPQGSPTSPTLTNILCRKLDNRLAGMAKRLGTNYSRYADDITFSSIHNVYTSEVFQNELRRIIEEDQGLEIQHSKTRLLKSGYRQEATGLIVNEKVNVRRRYIKQIRMWLYYWERYGYHKAQEIFERDYMDDKGHIKKGQPSIENVLYGKLEYLGMVKGFEDSTFKGLKIRFDRLTKQEEQYRDQKVDLESVVDTLLEKGITEGVKLYERFKKP